MPWLRRWRRKHGRKQNNTVNAPTFRELFEQQQQQGLRTEQSLSTGDPRLLRTERERNTMEDAIVGGHSY